MQGSKAAAAMHAAIEALELARALAGKTALAEWRERVRRLWGLR